MQTALSDASSESAGPASALGDDPRLVVAKVLVEIGELAEGEERVVGLLEAHPDDLTALNLYAKIKHMRGELSQAVACWAQLHARAPHNERALMTLGSVLQLAKDPEKSAGEFLVLGQYQLARKPLAQLELETALRHFLARNPAQAVVVCEQIAAKYHASDRDLYKLAVMAKAWIAEMTGELERACVTLEALGAERGFETDIDRVLSLARVYERIGSREHLEKAVLVYRHLERTYVKMSAISSLAALYRKLGMEGDAARYEARYTEAFQRRMHRPTLGELAAAAASTFLPLSALRRVGAAHGHGTAPPGLRARAVLAALAGRFDEADSLFAEGGAVLDAKYRASLAALRGDVAEAVRRFVATVADDAADVRVLTYLLAEVEADSALLAPLSEEPLRGAVSASLDQALAARPLRAPLWRSLATFHRLLDEHDEAGRCADRARVLEDAAARDARPVGRVLAAAVYHFVGKAKGLVHQIWVDRVPAAPGQGGFLQPEDVFGNITPELKASVRNIFFAVREYTRSRFPHRTADILDYDYAYKVTKEDEPSGGLSAGLATALGFLSVFLQEPVPQDVAFSGVVIADSHDVLVVRHVAEVEFKVKAAYNRNLRRILLPRDNRVDVRDNPRLPRALTEGLVGYVANLDEAVTEVWGAGVWTR